MTNKKRFQGPTNQPSFSMKSKRTAKIRIQVWAFYRLLQITSMELPLKTIMIIKHYKADTLAPILKIEDSEKLDKWPKVTAVWST